MERADEIVLDAKIEIGSYRCKSNWVVAGCHYDVLLGSHGM